MNTTLCQLKLKQWKELTLVADKILELQHNPKAVYRKCVALQGLQEYEQALHTIANYPQFATELQPLHNQIAD